MKSEAVEVEKESIRGTEGCQGDWDACLRVEGEGRQQEVRWEILNYDLGNIEEAMQYYLEGKTEVEKTDDYKTG